MKKKNLIVIIILLIIVNIVIISYIINNITDKKINIEKISKYNNPIIPNGFKKVETENASWELENGIPKGWNKGLVIEDSIGNQFVWIPAKSVENSTLEKEINYLMNEESVEERVQTEKNGGFYMARFEAGISEKMQENVISIAKETNDIVDIPVSKKNVIPWNFISLRNAKINAKSMYENEKIRSDLITSRQWINVIQWLSDAGYNIRDAKDWGNFSNVNFRFTGYYSEDYGKTYKYCENKLKLQYNMILSTGATKRNMSNNIYDLAGNLIEFTDGYVKNRGYYSLGGHFDTTGDCEICVAKLIGVTPLEKLGFRVVLYNK